MAYASAEVPNTKTHLYVSSPPAAVGRLVIEGILEYGLGLNSALRTALGRPQKRGREARPEPAICTPWGWARSSY